MIKAGIIGAAGYTGGETIRLLMLHPEVSLEWVQSESKAGQKVSAVHTDLFGICDLIFSRDTPGDADVIFMCKGHGESRAFLEQNEVSSSVRIIDLSQDFRLKEKAIFQDRQFIYGLPELNRKQIIGAQNISNPGCFATCIQLALLPLAAQKLLRENVHINATTGSTGAGQGLSPTSHFSWRSNNQSAYKVLEHQHLAEIGQSVAALDPSFDGNLHFIPQRGAFTRGIYCVTYLPCRLDKEAAVKLFEDFYTGHPFIHIVPFEVDVKQVVNTNRCFIGLSKVKDQLVVFSAIDNLLKGASGQAVQNMNLLFGLDETAGLQLKPSAF